MSDPFTNFLIENVGSMGSVFILIVFLNKKIDRLAECWTEFKLNIVGRVSKLEGKNDS